MSRLPPAEKLPLAVRKNIRDSYESKREEFEKKLSAILGQVWTIDINPNAIYPYGEEGSWGKTSTGDCIVSYIEGALYQLQSFTERLGDDAKTEINDICSSHTLKLDFAGDKQVSYSGCDVSPEGDLVILFAEGNLGTNADYALEREKLTKALNEAVTEGSKPKPMSYTARISISQEYTPKIGPLQDKVNKILGKEVPLEPGFEAAYEKLKAAKGSDDYWQTNMGNFLISYFEGLIYQLEYQKFGEDDMLQEGLVEALEGNAIRFRIVDKTTKSYNETVIEDGVMYLQTTADNFGVNVNDIAAGLVDIL